MIHRKSLCQDPSVALSHLIGPFCSDVHVQETILTPFSIVVDYHSNYLLKTKQVTYVQEAGSIHETRERVVWIIPELRNFTGDKLVALLALVAYVNDTFDRSGTREGKALRFQVYLIDDSAEKVYEMFTTIEMSTGAHFYHNTWSVFINALMFLAQKRASRST